MCEMNQAQHLFDKDDHADISWCRDITITRIKRTSLRNYQMPGPARIVSVKGFVFPSSCAREQSHWCYLHFGAARVGVGSGCTTSSKSAGWHPSIMVQIFSCGPMYSKSSSPMSLQKLPGANQVTTEGGFDTKVFAAWSDPAGAHYWMPTLRSDHIWVAERCRELTPWNRWVHGRCGVRRPLGTTTRTSPIHQSTSGVSGFRKRSPTSAAQFPHLREDVVSNSAKKKLVNHVSQYLVGEEEQ